MFSLLFDSNFSIAGKKIEDDEYILKVDDLDVFMNREELKELITKLSELRDNIPQDEASDS